MKKYIHQLPLWMILLCVSFFSCEQEDQPLPSLQGSIRFGGISLEFAPMGSPESRVTENSPWVHVFPNSADLVFTNKATGQQYVLEYNPNDFSSPYTIVLPFGEYEYHSVVVGGIFSAYLPFEASGEFLLDSQSLEITLEAETGYGLVTVKDQYVEKASVSAGEQESDLVLLQDSTYWFLYVEGGTKTTLNIRESFLGSSFSRELDIEAKRHYNFVLKLNEDAAAITALIMAPFNLEEEEIILGLSTKFFEDNGTIKCPGATPGEKGMVSDKIYEAVDRALLIKRRDEGADLSCVCTTLVTDLSYMFNADFTAASFNQPIGNWDVSNVTNMAAMFGWASSFNQPIGNWDVSNVTDMVAMFHEANSFNHPIGDWDVGNVTDMRAMFFNTAFNQPIGDWDVSNVTNMSTMFGLASSFNQPIGNWDVSKVTDMRLMFASAVNFNQPIGDWDVSNVTDMSYMFNSDYSAASFNQPLGNWDVSNVTNMSAMFHHTAFNQPIGDWDVSNVTNMASMFSSASSFKQPIGNWDVSNVTDLSYMFSFASNFNQPIGDWDVGNVTDMSGMFNSAVNFNQPIGNWDVSNVTNMSAMFSSASSFNQPIGNWDVSNVTDMRSMFTSAVNFNQPIGKWDVSNVTDMWFMFNSASSFNQPIENWDVSNVTDMGSMFTSAVNFNQPIGNWDVSNVTGMSGMFGSASSFNQDLSSWCVQNIYSEPLGFSRGSVLLDANKPVWRTCPG